MNALKTLGRIFLGWLALLAAQMVAGIIAPVGAGAAAHLGMVDCNRFPHRCNAWICCNQIKPNRVETRRQCSH
jgi:hypothetical protein